MNKLTIMPALIFVFAMFIGSVAAQTSEPPAAKLRLVDTIAVQAPDVTLGEIATIDTDDTALQARLANMIIAPAPSIDNPQLISAFKVRALLGKEGLANITEVFGSQSTVYLETRGVPDDEMLDLIKGWVAQRVKPNTETQIDFLKLPPRWKVPAGKGVSLTVHGGRDEARGNIVLTLRADAGNQVFAITRARIHVSLFRNTPVLIRPLRRGEPLTANDVEMRKADITNATGMEAVDFDTLVDMTAKRNITIGTLLSAKDFEKPIIIERGSTNRVLVINDVVKLSVSGAEALQSGREGEIILFRNPMNSREPLRARIIREGLAVIKLQ